MANTYAFAICGALILAVTLTPVLCSFLFHNKKEEKETFVDRIMKLRYLMMLDRVLRHRYLVLAVDGVAPGFHHLAGPQARGRVHAPAGGGEPLDPGPPAPHGDAPGSGADGASAPRGDRLDSRDPGRDVARRPARRRHRRDQLFQPRVQRPADPDGRVAEEAGRALRPQALGSDRSPARRSRTSYRRSSRPSPRSTSTSRS